eukprot:scaffold284802_cov17-Prasinocladus_malaysianus.AAC.1
MQAKQSRGSHLLRPFSLSGSPCNRKSQLLRTKTRIVAISGASLCLMLEAYDLMSVGRHSFCSHAMVWGAGTIGAGT